MKHDICGKNGAKVRRLTQTVGKGSSSFLVRNVPVIGCLSCGEAISPPRHSRSSNECVCTGAS